MALGNEKSWELVSGKLSDGLECLVLKKPTGETLCTYAPGVAPYEQTWNSYFNGFPKQEFASRDACLRNAEKLAGMKLEVRQFEYFKKAVI